MTLTDKQRHFIGERIRARRERLGLTQEAVARRLGIAAPSLSNYERGHRPILAEDGPPHGAGASRAREHQHDKQVLTPRPAAQPGEV